jgi:hypothetical protein
MAEDEPFLAVSPPRRVGEIDGIKEHDGERVGRMSGGARLARRSRRRAGNSRAAAPGDRQYSRQRKTNAPRTHNQMMCWPPDSGPLDFGRPGILW